MVKAYQKKTGSGRVEAVLAVDAIEKKHGVEFTPVPLKQRLRRVPAAITTVGACYALYFLFIRYVEISSILGWSIMFLAAGCIFIFFGVAFWRSRAVDIGSSGQPDLLRSETFVGHLFHVASWLRAWKAMHIRIDY
jgi:hypothetical protein